MRFSSTLSNCILKTSNDGDSTTSLGRFFQVLVYSHCKKFIPYIEMKPLLVQLVPIALCLCFMAPRKERTSILFVATL